MPDEVVEILEGVEAQQAEVVLDQNLKALLADVTEPELYGRVLSQGVFSLTDEERTGIVIALMRRFNKVTHIFELVKAYGSTSQVEYNRSERVWIRRANIASKHEHEIAVNMFSGQKLVGDAHAPLTYVRDPRSDIPTDLLQHLQHVIAGRDDVIVSGWLQV